NFGRQPYPCARFLRLCSRSLCPQVRSRGSLPRLFPSGCLYGPGEELLRLSISPTCFCPFERLTPSLSFLVDSHPLSKWLSRIPLSHRLFCLLLTDHSLLPEVQRRLTQLLSLCFFLRLLVEVTGLLIPSTCAPILLSLIRLLCLGVPFLRLCP